jgi:hypothetical protein
LQNGADAPASMRNCINTEVRFRALLTQDEIGNWKWCVPKE